VKGTIININKFLKKPTKIKILLKILLNNEGLEEFFLYVALSYVSHRTVRGLF
jgi:hypothetical protein